MKKLQFFGLRYSISVPKGHSITDLAENDIKRAINVKRVFSPRLANNLLKKQKV